MRRRSELSVSGFVLAVLVSGVLVAPIHGGPQDPAAAPGAEAGKLEEKKAPPPATPCVPEKAAVDRSYQMNVGAMPAVLRVGDTITVQINKPVKQITRSCFDGQEAKHTITPHEANSELVVTVPGDPNTPDLPPGQHKLTIVLETGTVETLLVAPVKLSESIVALIDPPGTAIRVVLSGKGFDASQPGNHLVRMERGGTTYNVNVCWTDADCAQKNSQVRGWITRGAGTVLDTIEITGLDPGLVRMSSFTVCRLGICSDPPLKDSTSARLYWVPGLAYVFALLIAGIIVVLVRRLRPLRIDDSNYVITALFIDKETNTYSLSKLQFYMWTFVAVFGYIQLLIARWWIQGQSGLPPIPSGLPGIVGLAAGTSVGSQIVTSMNGPKGAGQLAPSIADFVTTGEAVAADRVQFLVWTIVGSLGYMVMLTAIDPRVLVELPEVPFSILSISGISALGYLGGKLARQPGPVINEITIGTADSDPDAPAAPPPVPPPAASAKFGLLEIRGRSLSPDATFRVSLGEDPAQGEVAITFDRLEPKPVPPARPGEAAPPSEKPKPRVIDYDDPKSANLAKRLQLVVRAETPELKKIFASKSKHVLTIANPDSQKAMLTFTVPDTVRPV